MELEQLPENEREQTFCQEQGWEEEFQESDRILGIIAMRHAREKVMSLSWNVGAQWAGSHKSDELPVSKMVFFFFFFPSSKESRKQNGMVKLSLAVHWPDKYSSRTILPFYLEQEASSS